MRVNSKTQLASESNGKECQDGTLTKELYAYKDVSRIN